MSEKFKKSFLTFFAAIMIGYICNANKNVCIVDNKAKKIDIKIILGSTRKNRTSEKIGKAIKSLADKRSDLVAEIIDLKDYNLPFLNDGTPPSTREEITDPVVAKWSDLIKSTDAFIIVVPEYNAGYPGVLKNALDNLYKEWNNKPVAFVGYSGGISGGTSATEQLRKVTLALKMVPIEEEINIPRAGKSLDENDKFINKNMEHKFDKILDQLINVNNSLKK